MHISMRRLARRAVTRACLLAGAALLCLPGAGTAQAPTTLGAIYDAVGRGNPRIAGAEASARAAAARVPGARRPPDPEVQLGFMNYTLPGLAPMDGLGMRQLQVMQMLPLGGKLRLAGETARAEADAVAFRAREIAWEARSGAAMAFYDLHVADARLAVARETLRLLADLARTAEAMYRVGQGPQADVLRAQVEIARMAADTLRMTAMRAAMSARLAALAGDSLPASVVPAFPELPDSVPALVALQALAAARPVVRAGAAELRAAESAAKLAGREIVPDLRLGVQLGRGSATMLERDPDGIVMTTRRAESMVSLMVGASIPIFARDRQHRMRAEADAMRAAAQADLAAMQADTRARVTEVHAALVRARDLSALYRSTILPQAQATVASSLSAYRTGSVDFMTLLDNQMTVNRYREELATLEAEEGKAWAELEMLTSTVLLDPRTVRRAAGGTR